MMLASASPFSRTIQPEMFKALNEAIRHGSGVSSLVQLGLIILISIPVIVLIMRLWDRERPVKPDKPHDYFADALRLLPLSAAERQHLRALSEGGLVPEPLAILLSPQTFDLAVNALLLNSPDSARRAHYAALRAKLFEPAPAP